MNESEPQELPDIAAEWRARGAILLPSRAIITAPSQNTADFRRRAYEWLNRRPSE